MLSGMKAVFGFGGGKATQDLPKTFYELVATKADGSQFAFSELKGNPVMVVNVASKCGLTDGQYKLITELCEQHDSLKVVAFPCAQFMNQEHANPSEVEACMLKITSAFGSKSIVGSQLLHMAMVDVNGDKTHPVFQWLKSQTELHKGDTLEPIKWNFGKFLVDKEGRDIKYFGPRADVKEVKEAVSKL